MAITDSAGFLVMHVADQRVERFSFREEVREPSNAVCGARCLAAGCWQECCGPVVTSDQRAAVVLAVVSR